MKRLAIIETVVNDDMTFTHKEHDGPRCERCRYWVRSRRHQDRNMGTCDTARESMAYARSPYPVMRMATPEDYGCTRFREPSEETAG